MNGKVSAETLLDFIEGYPVVSSTHEMARELTALRAALRECGLRELHEMREGLQYAIAVVTGLVPAQATAVQMAAAQRRLDALKLIDATLTARLAAAEGDTWQPIETAPQDGTTVLAWRRGVIAEACRIPRDDCDMWRFGSTTAAERHFRGHKPTHWRPLPAAPIDTAMQAGSGTYVP